MAGIVSMGRFTAIGMRVKVTDKNALVINTCGRNDTAEKGDLTSWVWSNPTNRVITNHLYEDIEAVSVECLWQGTKLLPGMTEPDKEILNGNWRKNKGKRPAGAYAGKNEDGTPRPLLTTPGAARRAIYIPAFKNLIEHWLWEDREVWNWVEQARCWDGPVFLRDHDTGRGIDRNGPLSHAWILATWLNTGEWPA
jgi:hypothetical protein